MHSERTPQGTPGRNQLLVEGLRFVMCTKTLCSIDTGYYADTVEWCPVEGFEDYLVCGTYQLLERNNRDDGPEATCSEECSSVGNERIGNVQLYCHDETLGRLEKLQSFETSGVLDTKWLPGSLNGHAVLGAVTSDGELKQLVESTSYITSPQKLCLSMDWSSKDGNSQVVVSDSAGQMSLCKFNEGTSKLCQILQWTGHEYEAWITAFDAWNSAIVYSGGDDCLLRGWDTRTDCQKPTFTSKRHDMGVSSIQCNLSYEHIMATGR
ncbi:Diphthine methyltransferase [Desmophyllum pertusum]|uniref:Diphthine methyltransferase n=1 Tax=Desmophyllum pertusum TaxID=174260 RepID=A0A9W9YQ67_9CNID|nr:Diphthine methyltransferase [Desmophyllum pertusum]